MNETREQLLALKQELEARLEAIEADYRRGLDADSEEQAVQLENAEVLEALSAQAVSELRDIEAKLARLDAGVRRSR